MLDASAAVKLVLAEERSDRVAALVADAMRARHPVYGPPTLLSEALSAVYKRTRYRDPDKAIAYDVAAQALDALVALGIEAAEPPGLYARTLAFAHDHALTRTYDALYVVLARLMGLELWTDDLALINALGGAAPWVRWIGEYPLVEAEPSA